MNRPINLLSEIELITIIFNLLYIPESMNKTAYKIFKKNFPHIKVSLLGVLAILYHFFPLIVPTLNCRANLSQQKRS